MSIRDDVAIIRKRLARFDPKEWGGPSLDDALEALDRIEQAAKAAEHLAACELAAMRATPRWP